MPKSSYNFLNYLVIISVVNLSCWQCKYPQRGLSRRSKLKPVFHEVLYILKGPCFMVMGNFRVRGQLLIQFNIKIFYHIVFKPESLTNTFLCVTQINMFRHQWYPGQHLWELYILLWSFPMTNTAGWSHRILRKWLSHRFFQILSSGCKMPFISQVYAHVEIKWN